MPHSFAIAVTSAALLISAMPTGSAAVDWGMARGDAAGTGHKDFGVQATTWTLTNLEPNIQAFYANPYPAVAGTNLYILAAGHLVAVDRVSGQEKWRHWIGTAQFAFHPVGHGLIFITEGYGPDSKQWNLVALNSMNGEESWRKEHDSCRGYPHAALGDLLYWNCDELQAFDPHTGDERWSIPMETTTGPPIILDNQLFVADERTVYALNAKTGRINWIAPAFRGELDTWLAADDRHLYTAPQSTSTFDAYNISTGKLEWRFTGSSANLTTMGFSQPAVSHGTVYTESDHLYALNATDGTVRWKYKHASGRVLPQLQPAVWGGRVYVAESSLIALNAATGEVIWEKAEPVRDLGASFAFSPVVSDGIVYWTGFSGKFMAMNATTGEISSTMHDLVVRMPAFGIGMPYLIGLIAGLALLGRRRQAAFCP